MSLDRCFVDLELGGKIDPPRSAEARRLYEELKTHYSRSHSPDAAASLASKETVRQLEAAAAHKKRNLVRQVQAQAGAIKRIREFNGGDGTGPLDPRGAVALFDRDSRAGHNDNVEARRQAIKGRAHAMMTELLYQQRTTITGRVRDPAQLEQIVNELFVPGSSGNLGARELADAWTQASEYLRGRFNEAGGQIGKLERWGLPQSHSVAAIDRAGFNAWRDYLIPRLDRDRMIDHRTGAPFTDQALEPFLRDVFETLRSDGLNKLQPGAAGGKMLANSHADHRILHFRDAESWLSYNRDFGQSDPLSSMMGHVELMSRDIALMEILGPNPSATVRWLQDTLNKDASRVTGDNGKARRAARTGAAQVQRLYDEITGANRVPENEHLAMGFSAFRSFQTAAKLGGAMLSAVTDAGFGAVTRRFNGLPARRMLGGYLKQLNPASAADRKLAVRAGLIAEEWAHITASQNRYLGEELTGEWSRRLANGVLKASGLNAWTQGGRWAFGMEFLGHLTDNVGKRFGDLDAPLRRTLERNGIGADGWERIRATRLESDRGVEWLFPQNVEDRALGDRLLQMIHTESDFAVPAADLRTRSMLNANFRRGTPLGEVARTAFQFKTFGVSMMLTHGRRAFEQGAWNGAKYVTSLFIGTTLLGALALQLKEISKGKDPRPMSDDHAAEFWGAAVLQGGGFGIFGDFLGASENRFGGGLAGTLAGPGIQTAQNVGNLTIGNAAKAIRGDDTRVGRDVVKLLKQETPGGSLWYGRLALERLVLDQLQEQIDPDYRDSFRRMKRQADERGQEFWWEPGDVVPERAPVVQE